MLENKYKIAFTNEMIQEDIRRLTNQLWKLIPMRENQESWKNQLVSVIIEIVGLNEMFDFGQKYLILLSKLEGLLNYDTDFAIYRRTVFESISLLHEVIK